MNNRLSIKDLPKKMSMAGFGLLEVLIASTILAFISLGIVSVTNNSLDTKERVLSEDKEFLQTETALTRLESDFSQIYTPLFFSSNKESKPSNPDDLEEQYKIGRFEGFDSYAFETNLGYPVPIFKNPEKSTFEFMVSNNRRTIENTPQSHYAWVRYELRPTEEQTSDGKPLLELVRSYSALPLFEQDSPKWEESKSFVLMKNLIKWEFEFWDEKEKKFVSPLTLVKNGKHLIRAIKVNYIWADKAGNETEEEVTIRANWPYFDPENDNKDKNKNE